MDSARTKKSFIDRFLTFIEVVGNKIPDPLMLFVYLTLILIVLSAILSWLGVTVVNPQDPTAYVEAFNLLSSEGIAHIFSSMVSNFMGFMPFGQVITVMIGIGVLEQTGLLSVALKKLVLSVPKGAITATLVLAAILSNIATDAGYVVIIPLGAILFKSMGRHPIAGLAAAFAGVATSFSANLIVTPLDVILASITQEAVNAVDPTYTVSILGNYYFMVASTIVLVVLITLMTEKFIEPRLGTYNPKDGVDVEENDSPDELEDITPTEKKALRMAGLSMLATAALLSLLIVPSWGPLRGDGRIVQAPFFTHLVPVLVVLFMVPGVVYGKITGDIKGSADVSKHINTTMASMAAFIGLSFAASQFVNLFNVSNLGTIMSVSLSNFLQNIGFTGGLFLIAFMLLTAFVNMFILAAAAQWMIFAPIFVPIMMQMGYTPEFIQLAFRVGDSPTNSISPVMAYFVLILITMQKYDKKAGIGSLVSLMVPFTIAIFIVWSLLLFLWMFLDLPIGPGIGIFM